MEKLAKYYILSKKILDNFFYKKPNPSLTTQATEYSLILKDYMKPLKAEERSELFSNIYLLYGNRSLIQP